MIINIKNFNKDKDHDSEEIISIKNIITSFGEGKHIILAPKDFFSYVIQDNKSHFDRVIKTWANAAKNSQIEYKGLLYHVEFNVELDFTLSKGTKKWVNSAEGKEVFCVSSDFFYDSCSIQKISVVSENPSDADFYGIIANYFSKKINAGACKILWNSENGGGGSTKDTFSRSIKDKKITLCIVDNDKKHPSGEKGTTCGAFGQQKYIDSGRVEIIPAHEVECLIPIDTIESLILNNLYPNDFIDDIDNLKKITYKCNDAKLYFDHKNGISTKKAISLDKKYGSYWVPLIFDVENKKKNSCLREGECSCDEGKPCFQIRGYGSKLLINTIKHINENNSYNYTPKLPPPLESLWNEIGKLFFSWCCAPTKKIRV